MSRLSTVRSRESCVRASSSSKCSLAELRTRAFLLSRKGWRMPVVVCCQYPTDGPTPVASSHGASVAFAHPHSRWAKLRAARAGGPPRSGRYASRQGAVGRIDRVAMRRDGARQERTPSLEAACASSVHARRRGLGGCAGAGPRVGFFPVSRRFVPASASAAAAA